MNKVLFLDIDGPMLPARAWIDHPEKKETIFLAWDPIAVRLVNRLIEDSGAKLVISSTWRLKGESEFIYHMEKNMMDPKCLHSDWATPKKLSSTRNHEVHMWLDAHPETDRWVSLDDDIVEGKGAIRVSYDDGIQFIHFNTAREFFGLERLIILG